MQNKRMYVGMALVFALILGYSFFVEKVIKPKHPEWDWAGKLAKKVDETTTQPSATASPETTTNRSMNSSTMASTGPSLIEAATQAVGTFHVAGLAEGANPIVLGATLANDPTYSLGLNLANVGAGIDSVVLNQFKNVQANAVYTFQKPYDDSDTARALATTAITVNGQRLDVAGAAWKLESSATNSVTYSIDIANSAGVPVLRITKTYAIEGQGPEKNRDNTTAGYVTTVTYHVQNLTAEEKTVSIAFVGPTVPPKEVERGIDQEIIAGYDKGDQSLDYVRNPIEAFKKDAASKDLFKHDKGYKLLWVGTASTYFDAIVQTDKVGELSKVEAVALNPESEPDHRQVVLDLETADIKVPATGSAVIPLKVFFGPKKRALLEGDYYSSYPLAYNGTLTSTSSCFIYAMCVSGRLVDWLVDLLRFFHFFLRDWGLSIIALVIMVRLCLHPITKHSQISMLKMQKMGPELERLKKKYGDDKEGYAKAQMQLYKEVGFTPILGCLPMFLQMPIWIALYAVLQSELSLRQAPFLWGHTWIHDLARPDRLIAFDAHSITIPLIGMKIISLNVLPILMAVVFFLQQKYTPKPPAATPEQAKQQKMMQWMSMLFPIFLYTYPSGLNLYILTSTTIGVVESKRIRDHIKQRQEQEKSDKVIIDAKPTRQGKLNKKEEKELEDKKKAENTGCITGWWSNMQQRVEDLQKQAEKANKKNM